MITGIEASGSAARKPSSGTRRRASGADARGAAALGEILEERSIERLVGGQGT
jgi:hypothetical protein